jgi:predicted CxxxxCH...CXXCH cytochrome family protein
LTGIGQVSNNLKVGAHQTHLRFFNGFSNYSTVDYRCSVCHGTLTTSGSHANGSSTPVFSGLASKGMTPVWTPATVSCSNTYCHNPAGTGGTLNTANAGTRTFVSWTSSSYLGDTRKTQANCNMCHKSPGTVANTILVTSSTSHTALTITSDCAQCHDHNGDSAGAIGKRHMDGIKFGGGGTSCDGCHAYDAADWGVSSTKTNNYNGLPAKEGWGAHEKHIAWIKTSTLTTLNPTGDFTAGYGVGNAAAVCGVCHSNNAAVDHTTAAPANGRNINFNSSTTYQFGASLPLYNGGGAYQSTSSSTPKTCQNLSCHYFTTVNWSQY